MIHSVGDTRRICNVQSNEVEMRTIPMPKLENTDEAYDKFYNSGKIGIADTNQTYDCLESIDRILRTQYDLEIVLIDNGSSDYVFTIEPEKE
jgi:hypothetical protein